MAWIFIFVPVPDHLLSFFDVINSWIVSSGERPVTCDHHRVSVFLYLCCGTAASPAHSVWLSVDHSSAALWPHVLSLWCHSVLMDAGRSSRLAVLSADLFWNKVTLCEHTVRVSREGPCCFRGLPVFLCVLWWCCILAGLSTLVFWWPLQRRRVAGKGVEGGAEMGGVGDEHCCGLHHHHHHHHHQHQHPHHHHHHHHDLHEDSLGSDSSLGAQSDLSEDSTQVRLLAWRPGSLHAPCPSAVLPLLCRHPALQSRLLWAAALMKRQPCWHGTLSEDASWPETIETANISSCGLRMVVLSVSVQHKYSFALNLSSWVGVLECPFSNEP